MNLIAAKFNLICPLTFVIICVLVGCVYVQENDQEEIRELLMPDVQPMHPDAYFCTAFKVPRNSLAANFYL